MTSRLSVGWSRAMLGAWLGMASARAQAQRQEQLPVPTSCGSQSEFRSALRSTLGDAELESPPRLSIEGPARDGRYRLRVELDAGARVLWDRDCRALFRSAVLIVATDALESQRASSPSAEHAQSRAEEREAVALERVPNVPQGAPPRSSVDGPSSQARPAELAVPREKPAARPAAETDAPRKPTRVRVVAAQQAEAATEHPVELAPSAPDVGNFEAEARPSAWRAHVGLGMGALVGLGPQTAPLVELVAAAERGSLGIAVGLHYVFQTATDAQLTRGAVVDALGAWAAGSVAPLEVLRLRVGMAFDRLTGEGKGSVLTLADGAWTLGPRAELVLLPLHTGSLQLELGTALQWALLRPSFEIGGFGPVYRAPALSGSGIVRLSWTFR